MPPPQHWEIGKFEWVRGSRAPGSRVAPTRRRSGPGVDTPLDLEVRRKDPLPPFTTITTECIRWGGARRLGPLPWSFFPVVVLFVFVSCVVPLSTPSSTHDTVSTTIATLLGNGSFSNNSLVTSSDAGGAHTQHLCPTAKLWINTRGSFCFTLRTSAFLRNLTELRVREKRAIDMFCELDNILEKVDCAQPYSVNVDRKQCWLCREAYRDWACAMMTDTLEDGRMDCEGGVMPCPSCASICHQVMRLCPYLTPDRVQFDEYGDPTPHVSQYGGHPAFYCPLENIRASDPAYRSECSNGRMYSDPKLHDSLHNSCAENAKYMSKRSAEDKEPLTQISTCCWTYASSLVQESESFEAYVRNSSVSGNRVLLNCCDASGKCISSDPNRTVSNSSSSLLPSVPSSPESPVHQFGSTLRTANNQVRGEDGTFRELSNAYLHDDPDEDEDDEEYYDDSSSSADSYSSGGSSNERNNAFNKRYYSSSSVVSIHRDNKVYVTRESRSVHETFYIKSSGVSSSGGNVVACVLCSLVPPLVVLLMLVTLQQNVSTLSTVSLSVMAHLGVLAASFYANNQSVGYLVLGFRIVQSCYYELFPERTSSSTTKRKRLLVQDCCSRRRRCSCCETFVSNYSNLNNLPINYSNRKLVVNDNKMSTRRYYHVVMGNALTTVKVYVSVHT